MDIETAGRIFLVAWLVLFLIARFIDSSTLLDNFIETFILTVACAFIVSPFLAAFGLFG